VEGKLQKYDLNFEVPKADFDNNSLLSTMKNDYFIVIFRDSNGRVKVFGYLENPVRFTSEHSTGSSARGKNGYACKFYTEGTTEVVSFYGFEMPAIANEQFIGKPVTIKKNGQTIAIVPAGSVYEIPPTEWDDLQGSLEEAEELWGYITGFQSDLQAIGLILQTADIDLDTLQEISDKIQQLNEALGSVHSQNTDTKLAEGTEFEVTAEELKNLVENPPSSDVLAPGTEDEVTAVELREFLDNNKTAVVNYNPAEVMEPGLIRAHNNKFWKYVGALNEAGHTPAEDEWWDEVSKAEAVASFLQTTGQSTTAGMSQKAITDLLQMSSGVQAGTALDLAIKYQNRTLQGVRLVINSFLNPLIGRKVRWELVSQNKQITGTVTITTNVTVTGTGTLFLSELAVGQTIQIGGLRRVISAISSNTVLTVSQTWGITPTNEIAYAVDELLFNIGGGAVLQYPGYSFIPGLTNIIEVECVAANKYEIFISPIGLSA
jgi:hypothetical protein